MNPSTIDLDDWPQALADRSRALVVSETWYGRQVRSDRWSVTENRKQWNILYLVQEGSCEARMGAASIMLEPGSLVWWPAGVPLTLTWPPLFVFSEVWFTLEGCRLPGDGLVAREAGDVLWLFDACADELARPSNLREERLRHLVALILLEFSHRRVPGRRFDTRQRTILAAHLRANLHRRPSAVELARVVDLTPDYFARVFATTYGRSPRAWMVEERIRAAGRLLRESSDPVHVVAERLGYGNVAQFCRQFRQIIGQTPSGWRSGTG